MKSRAFTYIAATMFAVLAISPRMAGQHTAYKLIHLAAGFSNAERGTNGAPSLTAGGKMTGAFTTSTPTTATSNPLISMGLPFVPHAFKWYKGAFTDLGALPGNTNCSIPFQVNALGLVAGVSENGELDPLTGFNQSRAILWKDGQILDLGSFGGNQNAALTISTRGEIGGSSLNTIPDQYSIVDNLLGTSNGTQTRGFLWENGHMQDIGTLGGNDTVVSFVNDSGQATGVSYTNTTANPSTGIPTLDPFLWDNGKMVDLGTLGGVFGSPLWLNNHGEVVGVSDLAGDTDFHPFLWTKGTLFDLDSITAGGQPIIADTIDDAGTIIGAAAFPNAPYDAFLWKDGVASDLGHVQGDCFGEAFGINSRGQIVGVSISCEGADSHAFLWEKGEFVDLNTLVPSGSPHLIGSVSINERGEIIAGDNNGQIYLLVPTKEEVAVDGVPSDSAIRERRPTATEASAMRARSRLSNRSFKGWPRH